MMALPSKQNPSQNQKAVLSNALSLGMTMVVGMVVFAGGGYWIDQKTGSGGGWTLGGIFLGLFYGGYEVWKIVNKLNSEDKKSK